MPKLSVDVLVVGSGFAGSLLATILQQRGLTTAMVDRARHPRFAIGESSTPTANFLLRDLATTYELDWLLPLCKYGTWRSTYPELRCGLKRGFSYFQHVAGKEFVSAADHSNELLVAASSSDATSDTQWFRSDIDHFLFQHAQRAGTDCREETVVTSLEHDARSSRWQVELRSPNGSEFAEAAFIVDASGSSEVLVRMLDLPLMTDELRTNSRAIFGHFVGLPRWEDVLNANWSHRNNASSSPTLEHPFACDDAALHHVLEEGWMWWIRFDSGVTSVGLVLDGSRASDRGSSASEEWQQVLARYPTLIRVLNSVAQPPLIKTSRLQRCVSQIVGSNWALLPHTAGFIDPLHSTGIAHSLAGVGRLAAVLLNHLRSSDLLPALQGYALNVQQELRLIDLFVSGGYRAIEQQRFQKFVSFSMGYFAAATTWERRRLADPQGTAPALFLSDDATFLQNMEELHRQLTADTSQGSGSEFNESCRARLEPYNHVGLFVPQRPNMYGATAVPE